MTWASRRWSLSAAFVAGVEIRRTQGWRGLWFALLGSTAYRRLILVERRLDRPAGSRHPSVSVAFDLLGEDEIDQYRELRPDTPPEEVRRRMAAGHLCFLGRSGGRVIAAGWVAPGRAPMEYLGCELKLSAADAFAYDGYTVPELRGRGVATARHAHQVDHLRELGFQRALMSLLPENRSSFGPADQLRYIPVSTVRAFRLGPWSRLSVRPIGNRPLGLPAILRMPRPLRRLNIALARIRLGRHAGDVIPPRLWGAAPSRRTPKSRGPLRAVVVHHTAIPADHLAGASVASEAAYVRDIQRLHQGRGWHDIGYHFVIMPSGRVYAGRDLAACGAHVWRHNKGTIGIAVAGDFDREHPTPAALASLDQSLARVTAGHPAVPALGHRDLGDTTCPGRFLYGRWLKPRAQAAVESARIAASVQP